MQKQQPGNEARKTDNNRFQCKTSVKAGSVLTGVDKGGNLVDLVAAKLSEGNKAIVKIDLDGLQC